MAQNTFRCKLVTPAASLVDDAVTYASVPAWDGLFGVLPGRAPILAKLGVGELRLSFPDTGKGAGGERSFLIDGGFVQMAGGTLTVLAERATPAEQLSETDAAAQLRAAEGKTVPANSPDPQAARERLGRELAAARAALKIAQGNKRGI